VATRHAEGRLPARKQGGADAIRTLGVGEADEAAQDALRGLQVVAEAPTDRRVAVEFRG
jgi:hypothetical protein